MRVVTPPILAGKTALIVKDEWLVGAPDRPAPINRIGLNRFAVILNYDRSFPYCVLSNQIGPLVATIRCEIFPLV